MASSKTSGRQLANMSGAVKSSRLISFHSKTWKKQLKVFGMSVCDGSQKVNVTEKAHNLLLSGLFLNKEMVLVRAIIGFNVEYGCVLKVTCKKYWSLSAA